MASISSLAQGLRLGYFSWGLVSVDKESPDRHM